MPWGLIALGALAVLGVVLAARDRAARPFADFVPHSFTKIVPGQVPGSDFIIVPIGVVTRLPFISPRCWSAYLVGENLVAAQQVAGTSVATIDAGFPWLPMRGQNIRSRADCVVPGTMQAGSLTGVEWSKLLSMLDSMDKGSLVGESYSSTFGKACQMGVRIKAAPGYGMGLSCWPPVQWTSAAHRDLWWRHYWAWHGSRYQAMSRLGCVLDPDWGALVSEIQGNQGPDYVCPQHFGYAPWFHSQLGVNDPSNGYVLACVLASTCGFLPGSPYQCPIPGFTDRIRKKLDVVAPDFNAEKPYMDQVKALGAGSLVGFAKGGAVGGIVGLVGVVSAFFDQAGNTKQGNARSLWSDYYKPVAVPRSLLGAAGPSNYLVTEADISPLSPESLSLGETFTPHTFKVIR
jgi:hypothetical protein